MGNACNAAGKGKGKGDGKGKGKGVRSAAQIKDILKGKFQIQLSGDWKDYGEEEDTILKKAFLVGQPNCKFFLRGQEYTYDFVKRMQINAKTGKERSIRAPPKMTAPKNPLLPPGAMVVCTVPNPVTPSMEIKDPANPGRKVTVAIPPNARPGMRLAVPVPDKGEDIKAVVARQQGWSTGAKVATGAAAVGALAVGGVVLGEHLSGGAFSAWGEDAAASAADWVEGTGAADWAASAAEDAGDWAGTAAEDVGDWTTGAAADAADWGTGAVEDVGEWGAEAGDHVADFAEDAGDWFGGAAEDTGDFITSLF